MRHFSANLLLLRQPLFVIFFALVISSQSNAQLDDSGQLTLNGLAAYQQLRNEYYIGALYLENPNTDTSAIINSAGKRRMELRVTIERWSPRRFAQQWNQLILINNEQAAINALANEILKFIDIPKEELIAGDVLIIDNAPDSGTRVYLNDTEVFNVAGNDFFTLLLNTWIGQRPPATAFKNDILTLPTDQQGEALLSRFKTITPSSQREQNVAAWFKEKQGPATADSTNDDIASAPPGAEDNSSERQDTESTKQPNLSTAIATDNLATDNDSTLDEPKASKDLAASAAINTAPPALDLVKPQLTDPPQQVDETVLAEPVLDKTVSEAVKASELAAQAIAKAKQQAIEQETLREQYRSEILRLTYNNTQYPKRALDFKQEGQVLIQVTLSRNGQLLGTSEEIASKYSLLNKAALKAIKKTAPFPVPPEKLQGNPITLSLPFIFKL